MPSKKQKLIILGHINSTPLKYTQPLKHMYMWLYVLASMNTLQKLKLLIVIFYRYNSVVSQQGKIDSCTGCLVYYP